MAQEQDDFDARTPEVTNFGAACRWTGILAHDRAKWLTARRTLITASKVSALLGLSPFQDELSVYVSMICPVEEEAPEPGIDSPLTWGTALEEAIARTAAKHYRWTLQMGGALLVSRKHPHLGATLDAEILPDGLTEWEDYEGKTTSAWRAKDWSEDGVPPDHVLCQVQSQLLVTKAPRGQVFCLIGGQKPCRIPVDPSPEFAALILETVEEFMVRIARLDPPPPSATSKAALAQLYPKDSGEVIQLPAEAVEWTRELQEIALRKKETQRREDELRNLLRAAIGDATIGELPEEVGGKGRWRWAMQETAGYYVKPSSGRVLLALKGNAPAGAKKPSKSKKSVAEKLLGPAGVSASELIGAAQPAAEGIAK